MIHFDNERYEFETKDQISKYFGWMDFDHMMLNEDNIESLTKHAINLVFLYNGFNMPFNYLIERFKL